MSLLDSLRSMFGSSSGQKNRGAIRGKVNIDERFERMRYSSSGTMSNFFVARDRENDKVIGVKLCDADKVKFFENRFRGLNKPTEGEIAMSMHHPLIVEKAVGCLCPRPVLAGKWQRLADGVAHPLQQ